MALPGRIIIVMLLSLLMGSIRCAQPDPVPEDTPELVTKATLTFTPTSGSPIVVTATDPDGEGVQNITVDGPINLLQGTTYVMTVQMINGLVPVGQPGYDLTTEIANEGVEHQFFFGWSNNPFSSPAGDGNIDHAADPVNYSGGVNSKDANGLNLGITTTWTTGVVTTTGTFRLVLKHQPGTKTTTSDATVGETDLDLTFAVNVQ